MYKLILIDDEDVTLEYLSSIYTWEDYGFELAGTFSNGAAAADFLKGNSVDLIISDIKMPLKNGLELAKSCQEPYPDTWFIFISAHRDFSYAQEATKYNVIDYLTKPLDLSAFEDSLLSAYKKLSASKSVPFVESSLLSLQQKILSHILCDTITNSKELAAELEKIGLNKDILCKDCALLTLRFKNFQSYIQNSWKYGIDRFYNALSFLLPTNQNLFCSLIRYSFDTAEFVCFHKTNSETFSQEITQYTEQFQRNISEILHPEFDSVTVQFFSSFSEMRLRALSQNTAFATKSILEKAMVFINDHYNENISLKEVAEHVSLNHIYFSAFFKQHTNENFSDYLQKIRLKKALGYLKDTDLPIASICEMIGYKNITHFYNLVKAQTNMTPKEYRVHMSNKEENHAEIS